METVKGLGSEELEVKDLAVDGPSRVYWSEEAAAIGVESDGQIVLFAVAVGGRLCVKEYQGGSKDASGRRLGRSGRGPG